MKLLLIGAAALGFLAGTVDLAMAAINTTVIHKESPYGDRSKTVVKHSDGSKTVIKRHLNHVKKIHTEANGDKTVIRKTAY